MLCRCRKNPSGGVTRPFLDENLEPFLDQWRFLQSVQRMQASSVEEIVRAASRTNALVHVPRPSRADDAEENLDPWAEPPSGRRKKDTTLKPPLPANVNIILGNLIYVPKEGLSRTHLNRIERIAAFQNPKFYENQALRFSNHATPRIICCAEDFPDHIGLPRGCI